MACIKCNKAYGFPEEYTHWVLCSVCECFGEITEEKDGQEITVQCPHCQGSGVCNEK